MKPTTVYNILSANNQIWSFSTDFHKSLQISKFHRNLSRGSSADTCGRDGRTDGQTDGFYDYENIPKTVCVPCDVGSV